MWSYKREDLPLKVKNIIGVSKELPVQYVLPECNTCWNVSLCSELLEYIYLCLSYVSTFVSIGKKVKVCPLLENTSGWEILRAAWLSECDANRFKFDVTFSLPKVIVAGISKRGNKCMGGKELLLHK